MSVKTISWTGSRVLQEVKCPDGETRQVQYMRDGIILFTDGLSAAYVRTWDDDQENTVIVDFGDQMFVKS